jgi:hypothetical protein
LLKDLLGDMDSIEWVRDSRGGSKGGLRFDRVVTIRTPLGQARLLVIARPSGVPGVIKELAGAVSLASPGGGELAVLVAPFVSERGREMCKRLGIGFVDTSGNAHIQVDGLLIDRWGQGSRTKERQVLRRLLSRKATWVIRRLLTEPDRAWTLAELAKRSGVSLGHAKKTVDRLDEEGYVSKGRGTTRLVDGTGLLDTWAASYRSDTLRAEGFYCPTKSQIKVLDALATLPEGSYALTLGAAASLVAPFVRSTDIYFYVPGGRAPVAKALDLVPVEFGGNVYIVTPSDESVLFDARTVRGLMVVSDLQLYLDLIKYPARGREQAEHLRERLLRV